MSREPQLTLDSLRTLDAIDRRGSFAAAAEELSKVPSALSYSVQKLEEELDLLLFDRSGHRALLTPVGKLILERGREILLATEEMINDARSMADGWEPEIIIGVEAIFDERRLFPLISKFEALADTRVKLHSSVLSGTWELLEQDEADMIIAPDIGIQIAEVQTRALYKETMSYFAVPDHPIHGHEDPLAEASLSQYRAIAVADSAISRPKRELRLFDKQPRLTVSTLHLKIDALLDGIGLGSAPESWIQPLLNDNKLKRIGDGAPQEIPLVLAWKNRQMGKAKQWFMRAITELCQRDNRK